jgi:hypothetical protein
VGGFCLERPDFCLSGPHWFRVSHVSLASPESSPSLQRQGRSCVEDDPDHGFAPRAGHRSRRREGERRARRPSRTAVSTWTTLRGQQRRVLGQRRADGDLGGSGDGDADHGAGLRRCSSPPRTRASRTGSWRTAGSSPTPARMANGSRGPTMGSTAMRRRLRCGWSRGGDGAPRLQSRSANSLSAGIEQCLAISAQVIVPILLENSAR